MAFCDVMFCCSGLARAIQGGKKKARTMKTTRRTMTVGGSDDRFIKIYSLLSMIILDEISCSRHWATKRK